MRTLARNKRVLYLCQKYVDNDIEKFKEPIMLMENFVPTNSDGDLISIGMNYPKYLRIKTDIDEINLFHPKDRLYIYQQPPEKHDILCKNADYEVSKIPSPTINELEVMLERLSSATDE